MIRSRTSWRAKASNLVHWILLSSWRLMTVNCLCAKYMWMTLSSAAPTRNTVMSLVIWCKSNIRCPWWVNWSSFWVSKSISNAMASSSLKKNISKIAWRSLECKTAKDTRRQCQPKVIWVPTPMVKSSIKSYIAPWLVLCFIYVHLGQI